MWQLLILSHILEFIEPYGVSMMYQFQVVTCCVLEYTIFKQEHVAKRIVNTVV